MKRRTAKSKSSARTAKELMAYLRQSGLVFVLNHLFLHFWDLLSLVAAPFLPIPYAIAVRHSRIERQRASQFWRHFDGAGPRSSLASLAEFAAIKEDSGGHGQQT
jgi:hypothetical protein